jgi:thiol-disulfide isomerase/thioredoxin
VKLYYLKTGLLNPFTNQNEKEQVFWNFELIDESGKSFDMLRLEGKTVFINVWATWCPPCIAELPEIQQLYSKFKDEDILFLMISRDESFEQAVAFKDRKGFTFPIFSAKTALPKALSGNSIPRTYVINSEGRVVFSHSGLASYNNQSFISFIKETLK